jgi:hypothetical protein
MTSTMKDNRYSKENDSRPIKIETTQTMKILELITLEYSFAEASLIT